MRELVLICGVVLIANLLVFVFSGGSKQAWELSRDEYNIQMIQAIAADRLNSASDFQPRQEHRGDTDGDSVL